MRLAEIESNGYEQFPALAVSPPRTVTNPCRDADLRKLTLVLDSRPVSSSALPFFLFFCLFSAVFSAFAHAQESCRSRRAFCARAVRHCALQVAPPMWPPRTQVSLVCTSYMVEVTETKCLDPEDFVEVTDLVPQRAPHN